MSFESDCKLLDKFIIINAGLSKDPAIIKQASIVSELQGIAGSIISDVKERYQKEGWMVVLDYLAPTIFARFVPLPAFVISLLMGGFGINMGDILHKASELVKGHFSNN